MDLHNWNDQPLPCDANLEGPEGQTRCEKPGIFQIDRVADTSMPVCAEHLGPVLAHANTVLWPPRIGWDGGGDRPPNALDAAAAEARDRELLGIDPGQMYREWERIARM